MKKWRRLWRSGFFLALCLLFLIKTTTLLWMPSLMLAIFFFAVDVLGLGRNEPRGPLLKDFSGPYGALGDYVVDATESYGLFIKLGDATVFVDIRKDGKLDQRQRQARFLYENQQALASSLAAFVTGHPEYKPKTITYIGLHSSDLEQGEVFWDPDGYTVLRGAQFCHE